MFDGIKSFQRKNDVEADGWIKPGGPTQKLLSASLFEKRAGNLIENGPFRPVAGIGRGLDNGPEDVKAAKRSLGKIGLYPVSKSADPSPEVDDDPDFTFAVSAFERAYKAPTGGRIMPNSPFALKLNRVAAPLTVPQTLSLQSPTNATKKATLTSPPKREPHQHQALNPQDFDEPAFGGWSPNDTRSRKETKTLEVPAYKRFLIKNDDWMKAHRALEEMGAGPGETRAFLETFAAEGGMLKDPSSSAASGILQSTMDSMRSKAGIPGHKLTPSDLTLAERLKVYRAFFNSEGYFRSLGGHNVLDEFRDPEIAAAVADTLFYQGAGAGTLILQKSVNAISAANIAEDGLMGPNTLDALMRIANDPANKKGLLAQIARRRAALKGTEERFRHFEFN